MSPAPCLWVFTRKLRKPQWLAKLRIEKENVLLAIFKKEETAMDELVVERRSRRVKGD